MPPVDSIRRESHAATQDVFQQVLTQIVKFLKVNMDFLVKKKDERFLKVNMDFLVKRKDGLFL